ncbi:MAG: hypothetical protein OEZ07_03735 [Dehalococcoidia bacterium]|nr:hypothetical protein [Dehalococcoidia bacterium]
MKTGFARAIITIHQDAPWAKAGKLGWTSREEVKLTKREPL